MPRSGGKKKWKSTNKTDPPAFKPKQQTTTFAKPVSEYDENIQTEVQALFEKKFAFERPSEGLVWSLPLACDLFNAPVVKDWDPEMNGFKAKLNDLKGELSDKDIKQWHRHTSFTHRSALVMPHLRNNYWAELCTQAWCKFHEIVSSYDLIQPGLATAERGSTLNSVHLCEAPGAFITSLNHFIKNRHKSLAWNWLATTLNPYYEGNSTDTMIADDRFILQTQGHWFFGEDNTGDLMDVDNLTSLKQRVQSTLKTVHLVTADGSINCQNDPAEQETVVSQLHYCEVVTAMTLLATGGSLVLKIFTLFEHQTACLMYLLNCTFQQVHVCKPATSKAGNSEVYVVCLGFTGHQNLQDHMPKFLLHFGPKESHQALFAASDIPASFLRQLRACAATFKEFQMAAISDNIWLYPQMSEKECHRITQVRQCCCQAFVERNAVRSIRKAEKICPDSSKGRHVRSPSGMFAKTSSKTLHGTFLERQQLDHGPWLQRLSGDYSHLDLTQHRSKVITQTLQNNRELMPGEIANWEITVGKRLTSVQSSSFCVAEVLDDWNLACTNSQVGCKEEDVRTAGHCEQAVVELMLADLMKLHKISRNDGAIINCLCVLTESSDEDSFLELLKTTGYFEFKDCPLGTSSAADAGTEVEMELKSEDPGNGTDSPGGGASSISSSFLADTAMVTRCCETLHSSKVPVVYSDCSLAQHGRPGLSELDTRLRFLVSVIIAMHALHIGGTLVVRIPGILTRFSAGLLYIIHKTFCQVTLMATVEGDSSKVSVVAQGFSGVHQALTKHLWRVHACFSETMREKDTDVLQFVLQYDLCERDFNSSLTAFNDEFLSAKTWSLVQAVRTSPVGMEGGDGHNPGQNR